MEMNPQDDDKPATQGMLRATQDMLNEFATKTELISAVQRLEFRIDSEIRPLKTEVRELKEFIKDEVVTKLDYLVGKSKDNDRSTIFFDKRLQDDRERLENHEARIRNLESKAPPA